MTDYRPEKLIWSNQDFEVMGWHDAAVWGLAADTDEFEYLIDLDYVFKWVSPALGESHFKFWVAPVTMVFENACDVRLASRVNRAVSEWNVHAVRVQV